MPIRELPSRPSLDHLKNQARKLLQQAMAANPMASERFAAFGITSSPKHSDALYVIAREYGFASWSLLKLHTVMQSEDAVEALIAAIKANDASLVGEVLARHPSLKESINEPLPNLGFDAPALIAATNKQNRQMIDVLLSAGANINARTRWWAGGFGVLDVADPELAAYLIAKGATIDIHAAARLGLIDQVQSLLAADPSLVKARGGDGQLPLHFAANVEIARILLDHGADLDARDIDHESTAAQYMASIKPYRHDVARFLISRGAQTDILLASALGDVTLVERILDYDPETVRTTVSERHFPKQDPKSGGCIYFFGFGVTKSPHMLAHEFGHSAVFDLLMRRSAPSLRLIQAVEIGNQPLAEEILAQHPALFDRLSSQAARRIVGVAVRNNECAVSFLLEHGWPSAATLENNQTALHYAAWHGNYQMVHTLLAHNAPVNVFETEHGGSPLGWALHGSLNSWQRDKGDYPGVTKLLLDAGASVPKPERPLEATEEVLEILARHSASEPNALQP